MNFDYSPLSRKLTPEELQAYQAGGISFFAHPASKIFAIIGGVAFLGLMAAMSIVLLVSKASPWFLIAFIVFVIFMVGGAALSAYQRHQRNSKLFTFAKVNNLQLVINRMGSFHPGIIFTQGHGQVTREALVFPNGSEIGNFEYTTGSGKNRQVHKWGYMTAKLARKLPHMLLDARSNNSFGGKLSNLPESLGRDQIMRLEGDFNDHFTLYAPKGYETDALYVFTPDVMAALIDHGYAYDIEVVDDTLIFYSGYGIQLEKEEQLKRSLDILSKVSAEILDQGSYYSDTRISDRPANLIAEPGRRLKKRIGIVTIITALLIFAYAILNVVAGFSR